MRLSKLTFLLVLAFALPFLSSAQTQQRVRIGVILPLTGEFAAWGEGIRRAIELEGAGSGSRFLFDFQDEGNCEAVRSLSAFRKFMADDVRYVVVGCLAGMKAMLPIAKTRDVLLLSVGLLDDAVFRESSRIINLATQLSTESAFLAKRVSRRGFHRVAILHWNDAFSEEFARTLKSSLGADGKTIVAEEGIDPKETDFRAVLLRIKSQNPDAFCFNVGQNQQDVLLRQISQVGLKSAIFSNYVFETPTVLALQELSQHVEYTFPLNSADNSVEKKEFDTRFHDRFGVNSQPTANSYFARDGLVLLSQSFEKCSANDVDCVSTFFKRTKIFNGLSGQVVFRDDGSNERPYGIKTVHDGKFIWVNTER